MKEMFNIIFIVDKERPTEKAFVRSITVSVLGILLCMIALCSTTWAWYSKNISSDSNTVYAANCDMSISVRRIDGEDYFDVEKSDGRYQLEKDVKYKISLKAIGSANSAYAIINYNSVLYYTEQFGVYPQYSTAEAFTFVLTFSENTHIEIYSRWGTSSRMIRDFYKGESYLDLQKTQETAQTTGVLTAAEELESRYTDEKSKKTTSNAFSQENVNK